MSSTSGSTAGAEPQRRQNRSIKRARQSCDSCKNRKTKCVQTGTGPCQYCASTGGTCSTSVRPQRRPYYRVSEEEYQCCMRLLRHFVPHATLDLKTMKAMLAEIEQGVEISSISSGGGGGGSPASAAVIETEESEVLQEELGCMIIDAQGSYRYVGADSAVRFANAVTRVSPAHHHHNHRNGNDNALIVTLIRARLPPATPETIHYLSNSSSKPTAAAPTRYRLYYPNPSLSPSSSPGDPPRIYLPPRDVCQRYALRFFDEIQSIYWFYSPEQFYTLVDRTYLPGGAEASSASWLCSLYCIFAICSARDESKTHSPSDGDEKTSSEYLAMAKALGLQVCDEADTDAVRALSLMSLALHSACYFVTAYLIIGMTVRMAYTLGLHRDISLTARAADSVSRARWHRLWWTIYLVDQEVAIQLGYPCAIVDSVAGIQTPLSCESILDPGRPTPHGYQAVCVALVKLKKKISHTLYVAPALSARKVVPFTAVTGCLADLREWMAKLPPHLSWTSGTSPSHRRAVAVLHLRYWTALIHVQRPFLLYTVRRGAELPLGSEKQRWYDELSGQCVDAADKAVGIVRRMKECGLLSSLVLFDSQCIQELVQVFLLGKRLYTTGPRAGAARDGLEMCMAAMRGMDAVGWCEKILPELTAQVAAAERADRESEVVVGEEYGGEGGKGEGDGEEEEVLRTPSWNAGGGQAGNGGQAGGGAYVPVDEVLDQAFFEGFQEEECNFGAFDMLDLDMDLGAFATPEGMYGHF
ncbi:putative fungal-specific transcription factor [Cercophora scortea]|uniref:Fungal-specific transcription factor n=1 Tax=Cercophora scortea TaxID=314031 RepID=A0AAE0M2W3_9PEZI|nr:putative fungal-specific transcription factor [Cercophora scortea]